MACSRHAQSSGLASCRSCPGARSAHAPRRLGPLTDASRGARLGSGHRLATRAVPSSRRQCRFRLRFRPGRYDLLRSGRHVALAARASADAPEGAVRCSPGRRTLEFGAEAIDRERGADESAHGRSRIGFGGRLLGALARLRRRCARASPASFGGRAPEWLRYNEIHGHRDVEASRVHRLRRRHPGGPDPRRQGPCLPCGRARESAAG